MMKGETETQMTQNKAYWSGDLGLVGNGDTASRASRVGFGLRRQAAQLGAGTSLMLRTTYSIFIQLTKTP